MKYDKSMNQQVLEGVIVQLVIYFLLIFFVNMHITIKKKVCAFIDGKQAFDMVLQDGLWTEILDLKRDRWKMFKIYY